MSEGVALTPERMAEIEARMSLASGTPAWTFDSLSGTLVSTDRAFYVHAADDVRDLLAAAKAVPDLLAEIKRLREIEQAARDLLEGKGYVGWDSHAPRSWECPLCCEYKAPGFSALAALLGLPLPSDRDV